MQVYYTYNQYIYIFMCIYIYTHKYIYILVLSNLHVFSRHTHVTLEGILKVYEMVPKNV